jgi:hypothetical protein
MSANSEATTVLIDKAAAATFAALPEGWQRLVVTGLPHHLDGARLVPISGGAWQIMIILHEDGQVAARSYRTLGRQAHTTQGGHVVWLPAFDIDPVETELRRRAISRKSRS